MPLNYRKNSVTCSTEYYSSVNDLNGPAVSQTNRVGLQIGGQTKYIGLVNSNHEQASDLTVRAGNQNLRLAKKSKVIETSVFAWGGSGCFLGINSNSSPITSPTLMCGSFFKCIYAGRIGLTNDNILYSWGCNNFGQLGDGTTINRCQPVLVCSACNFCYVTIGGVLSATVLAISTNNKLFGWGYNSSYLIGDETNVNKCIPTAICPLLNFCCAWIAGEVAYALTTNRKLYGWGLNTTVWSNMFLGMLGDGSVGAKCTPIQICPQLNITNFFTNFANPCQINNFFITETNTLYGWGNNQSGTVGNSSVSQHIYTPALVCSSCSFCEVITTNFSTYGITTDNKLYSWGDNANGRLGNNSITNTNSPTLVCGEYNFSKIVIGNDNVWALNCDNFLYAWGNNCLGQLGINSTTCVCVPTQVCGGKYFFIPSENNCRLSRTFNSCIMLAIREDKKLVGWGCNCCGVLGNGTINNSCIPVSVCCDYDYSCVVIQNSCFALGISNGSIYSWGSNANGTLGDGTTVDKCQPVKINNNCLFTKITTQFNSVFANSVTWLNG